MVPIVEPIWGLLVVNAIYCEAVDLIKSSVGTIQAWAYCLGLEWGLPWVWDIMYISDSVI